MEGQRHDDISSISKKGPRDGLEGITEETIQCFLTIDRILMRRRICFFENFVKVKPTFFTLKNYKVFFRGIELMKIWFLRSRQIIISRTKMDLSFYFLSESRCHHSQ